MKKLILLSVLPLTLACGQAFAQGNTTIVEMIDGKVVNVQKVPNVPDEAFNSFQESDKNGDGRISSSEARDAGIMEFRASDTNGDGYLDELEYANAN